jgi:hypothetical protein
MLTDSIQGIRFHTEMAERHARNIQNIEKADLPADMIGMMVATHGVTANIGMLRASLKMEESILDLLA